ERDRSRRRTGCERRLRSPFPPPPRKCRTTAASTGLRRQGPRDRRRLPPRRTPSIRGRACPLPISVVLRLAEAPFFHVCRTAATMEAGLLPAVATHGGFSVNL